MNSMIQDAGMHKVVEDEPCNAIKWSNKIVERKSAHPESASIIPEEIVDKCHCFRNRVSSLIYQLVNVDREPRIRRPCEALYIQLLIDLICQSSHTDHSSFSRKHYAIDIVDEYVFRSLFDLVLGFRHTCNRKIGQFNERFCFY